MEAARIPAQRKKWTRGILRQQPLQVAAAPPDLLRERLRKLFLAKGRNDLREEGKEFAIDNEEEEENDRYRSGGSPEGSTG
mmetsp:Transcript_15839/g.34708  ORF Transcript_15839/g.34708 Transcript_15839/m.34708 type:complete len:81 (+) Transcript_15839:1253-1495(+)